MPTINFPPLDALQSVRTPPLVNPLALQAAAAHCAEFGGNRELLNAAALAGALLQAHIVKAKRQAGRPLYDPIDELGDDAKSSAAPADSADISPEIKAAMRKARAAAEATNQAEARKREQATAQAGGGTLKMPNMAGGLALPGQGYVGQQHLGTMPTAMLQHPMMMMQQQPQQQPPPQQPPPRINAMQHAPIPMVVNAPVPPAVPTPPPATSSRDRAREEKVEDKREAPPKRKQNEDVPGASGRGGSTGSGANAGSGGPAARGANAGAGENQEEAVRCHLHRKPQLNCKICRRLYYSALDPGMAKKEERMRERGAGDRHRRGDEDDDDEAGGRRRGHEVFEIQNKQNFNFNAMLRDQILKNTYFKSLVPIDTFEGVVDELYQYADTAEVYGAGTTTVPSTLFCCLYRFFTIGLTYEELLQLCDNRDTPFVRCCGFLYIRFGCAPEKFWEHLGDYCLDDQEFEPSKSQPGFSVSVGEFVEALLMDERYFLTALPRIPVGVKKKIEEKIAPLSQYRKRAVANKAVLHSFQEPRAPVEVCDSEGRWKCGEAVHVDEKVPTRITVRVRLENGQEESFHLGKVILRSGARGRGRSRSRSPRRGYSPDLTRSKGKSVDEMVQDLRAKQRERAVCSSGKDYARKPIGFMSGLALKRDMGVASTRLREEETYAPRQVEHRKQMTEEDEQERRKEERTRLEADREASARMQQLYEKYGGTARAQSGQTDAVPDEAPEVLRLG